MSREAKHRDKIVRATAELLRRRGYCATGINEIVDLSGAPKGSLYHYFPGGKAQIAAEAVRYAGERVRTTIANLVATYKDPGDVIRAYGQLLAGWMAKSDFVDGCPITTTLLEISADESAVVEAGCAAFALWVESFALSLERAGVASARAHGVARSAIMLLEGALIFARVERSSAPITAAADLAASLFEAAVKDATQTVLL